MLDRLIALAALCIAVRNYAFLANRVSPDNWSWFVPGWIISFWAWATRKPINPNGGDGGDITFRPGSGGRGDRSLGGEDGLPGRIMVCDPDGVVIARLDGRTLYIRNDVEVRHVPFLEPKDARSKRKRPAHVAFRGWFRGRA